MFVSYGLLMPLTLCDIREIRHDIKSADISCCSTLTSIMDLRGKIVVSDHVDSFTRSRGFLQFCNHEARPSLEQWLLVSECLTELSIRFLCCSRIFAP